MVVRREGSQMRTYVHFGTGNYHPITARIYTDLSFFTCEPAMGRDAARLFNFMTGYARPENMEQLGFSPISTRDTLLELIEREIACAQAGRSLTVHIALAGLRPAFPDNLPRIAIGNRRVATNGLYRHGFLMAPSLAEKVVAYVERGVIDNQVMRCL